ncbi:MAG: carbon starvation protein A [Candidatus Adiutrix sp.]|nr:carbon starvation protein A [Candidatus Adiutrix sp.]
MPPILYFFLSLAALFLGYLLYGRLVDRIFRPDRNRLTPALAMEDDVDYMPLPNRELFLNQFLSISAIGPVFGPLMGVLYGPAALLWIVLGCIFAGGVHDYFSGMMSLRYRGESMPDVVGYILGPVFKLFMRLFSLLLLVLVGVVFAQAPAQLIDSVTRVENDAIIWLVLIFSYYFLATILPIEVIISRFNPFFTVILAVMALGVFGGLLLGDHQFYNWVAWDRPHPQGLPLWPLMFITIACGALSGFHATQSPITARCLCDERLGRQVFYGAMILEGCIALVWATAGMTLYQSSEALQAALDAGGPAAVVRSVSLTLLGDVGGLLAVLGVVALPITSGDTAFRAARLVVADFLKLPQKNVFSRLVIAVPLFAVAIYLTQVDFEIIWRYFGWSNQTLATIVLWTGGAYLVRLGACHWIATLPAAFMTAVVVSYIFYVDLGLGLPYRDSVAAGLAVALATLALFLACRRRFRETVPYELEYCPPPAKAAAEL